MVEEHGKEGVFFKIISLMGAALIFVGIAWLIAKNWNFIPDFAKVLILVFATFLAFGMGIFLRNKNHEGVGRGLLVLGAGLYILSLFLISQIYNLATSIQHYAWLLFMAWVVIIAIAYLLKSSENVVVALFLFFPWLILQYSSSFSGGFGNVLGPVLLFLTAGILLYSLSVFHNSVKHKYTNIYRFWTVLYFLLVFYILSFQAALVALGNYAFEGSVFSGFLIIFIVLSFFVFVGSILFASSKKVIHIKEILIFLAAIVLIFSFIMLAKPVSGGVGICSPKSCYDFKESSECNAFSEQLDCEWRDNRCSVAGCHNYKTEADCGVAPEKLNCEWQNSYCAQQRVPGEIDSSREIYEICSGFNNDVDSCSSNNMCKWRPSFNLSGPLPVGMWFLWSIVNIFFIGFIILVLGYGQSVGSTKIINLGMMFFILDIISRYIGFWMDFKGYVAFSILAILGGIMLILGAWFIPKWRKKLIKTSHREETSIVENG